MPDIIDAYIYFRAKERCCQGTQNFLSCFLIKKKGLVKRNTGSHRYHSKEEGNNNLRGQIISNCLCSGPAQRLFLQMGYRFTEPNTLGRNMSLHPRSLLRTESGFVNLASWFHPMTMIVLGYKTNRYLFICLLYEKGGIVYSRQLLSQVAHPFFVSRHF